MEFQSYQLVDFNIQGQIVLSEKFGLIKLLRSEDGLLILVDDANYGRIIDQENPSPMNFANPDSILGFVLDIGIKREKQLTFGHGYYFGTNLTKQSSKIISQKDFDQELFENIGSGINTYYQSGEKQRVTQAIQLQLLFDTYNNARLLFPNFYAESYLNLMRIIDALSPLQRARGFATFVAEVSSDLNREIYRKLNRIDAYKDRMKIAFELFKKCLDEKNNDEKKHMVKFDDAGKVVFSCFYSAFQYRNAFVHEGFPFPHTVIEAIDLENDLGTAYIHPTKGISWLSTYRLFDFQDSDLIDVHQVVKKSNDFKETYFQLLPTWYFVKCMTRQALLNRIIKG